MEKQIFYFLSISNRLEDTRGLINVVFVLLVLLLATTYFAELQSIVPTVPIILTIILFVLLRSERKLAHKMCNFSQLYVHLNEKEELQFKFYSHNLTIIARDNPHLYTVTLVSPREDTSSFVANRNGPIELLEAIKSALDVIKNYSLYGAYS